MAKYFTRDSALLYNRPRTRDTRRAGIDGVSSMIASPQQLEIQVWPIDRLVFYARNPRKNDAAVDRMCSSIREFGFKIPVLARSDGEVVDGHLRRFPVAKGRLKT